MNQIQKKDLFVISLFVLCHIIAYLCNFSRAVCGSGANAIGICSTVFYILICFGLLIIFRKNNLWIRSYSVIAILLLICEIASITNIFSALPDLESILFVNWVILAIPYYGLSKFGFFIIFILPIQILLCILFRYKIKKQYIKSI